MGIMREGEGALICPTNWQAARSVYRRLERGRSAHDEIDLTDVTAPPLLRPFFV